MSTKDLTQGDFFHRDAALVAQELLGKVIRHRFQGLWASALVIETEAYYLDDKASHASLGYTHARRALFAGPGTIYMYYARGKDSLNFSCLGKGNAVLIKSGLPYFDRLSPKKYCLPLMQKANPKNSGPRLPEQLCSGQTLLCRSLGLKVSDWNDRRPQRDVLRIEDVGRPVADVIKCRRLGIPKGRDEGLKLRFVSADFAKYCTKNPLAGKGRRGGRV